MECAGRTVAAVVAARHSFEEVATVAAAREPAGGLIGWLMSLSNIELTGLLFYFMVGVVSAGVAVSAVRDVTDGLNRQR
jgi:hypothetical protein